MCRICHSLFAERQTKGTGTPLNTSVYSLSALKSTSSTITDSCLLAFEKQRKEHTYVCKLLNVTEVSFPTIHRWRDVSARVTSYRHKQ